MTLVADNWKHILKYVPSSQKQPCSFYLDLLYCTPNSNQQDRSHTPWNNDSTTHIRFIISSLKLPVGHHT